MSQITINLTFDKECHLILTAEKDVLIRRSQYFQSMLTSNFSETSSQVINIDLKSIPCELTESIIRDFFKVLINERYSYADDLKNNSTFDLDIQLTSKPTKINSTPLPKSTLLVCISYRRIPSIID
jgi:hypothetical protein